MVLVPVGGRPARPARAPEGRPGLPSGRSPPPPRPPPPRPPPPHPPPASRNARLLGIGPSHGRWRIGSFGGFGLKAQSGIGNLENILVLGGDNRNRSGHPQLQLLITVLHRNHGIVGNDVLIGGRRISDLKNFTGKVSRGECLYHESHGLVDLH